jgi:hypothetical protein
LSKPNVIADRHAERVLQSFSSREHARTPELVALIRHAASVAPRIATPDYAPGFQALSRLEWVRPLSEHAVRGKGRDTVFRGLAEHLLARYPTPVFLYNAFFEDDAELLTTVVGAVAGGASLFSQCQSGALPVPLTRRMCHTVMLSPARTRLLTAIRSAQVGSIGGNPTLVRAWMTTDPGRRLQTAERETFWHGVLRWLVANPVPFAIVAPLMDYVEHRYSEQPAFSMKRRSASALLRAMADWHASLAHVRAGECVVFPPSGFRAGRFDRQVRLDGGAVEQRVWKIEEISSAIALAAEGSEMRHCVYAYAPAIERGRTSIWSMSLSDGAATQRVATIEVRNAERRVVQARGKCNRVISSMELSILVAWAGQNGLRVCV